ncbi:MAG: hypothetical protein LW630_07505 [Saprospiraceae bacterium]|nr:hypothetical protein [Saprospiraceae bacterium]
MEFLKSCLEKDGEDSFVRFALAKEYENGGQLEEAVRQYLILEQNDPGYVGLYYHLGHAYAELGKLEEALMTFDRGIEVARKMHSVSFSLIRLFWTSWSKRRTHVSLFCMTP